MSRKQSMPLSTPVILVLLGALVLAAVFIGSDGFSTLAGGVTVLSIDEPNVIGDANLRNLNWLVTTTLRGSDRVSFRLTPAEMEAESGVASERTFTATASDVSEQAVYAIKQDAEQPVYMYTVAGPYTNNAQCPSGTITTYSLDGQWFWSDDTYYCLVRSLYARTGSYDLQSTQFKADLTVANGLETVTRTVSSTSRSASFTTSDGEVARATWSGSLVTGNVPPSLNEYTAVLRQGTISQWQPVADSDVARYAQLQNQFETYLRSVPNEGTSQTFESALATTREYVSQLNGLRSSTIDDVKSLGTGFTLTNGGSASGAQLVFDTDSSFQEPVVTWWIRADWIGVERTAGMPRITSVPDVTFGSSSNAFVPVTIQNVGNGRGTFTVRLESCPGITMTSTPTSVTLEPSASGTVGFTIDNGASNTAVDETCTIRAYDINVDENQDTERFDVVYNPATLCAPNEYIADGTDNAIYRCNADGTTRAIVTQCSSTETVTYTARGSTGGYECVSKGTVTPPIVEGEGRFSPVLLIVTLVLSTGAGVYAWNATRRVNKWLGITVGIIAFVAVFLFVPAFVNGIIQMFTLNIPGFSVIP